MELSLEGITLHQIEIFLCVARRGGFIKAADDLHMTQSAVSKSIAKMEKELGISLFWRNTRKTMLTEAGELLYQDWNRQLNDINDSYIKARSLQDTEYVTLRIGLLNTARPERYFWDLEDRFRRQYPDIRLLLASEYMTELGKKLADRRYDAVMVPDFEHFDLERHGMCWKWAARSDAQALMSAEHPLAQNTTLKTEDLLNEEFVAMENGSSSSYRQDLAERFSPWQVKPNIVLSYQNAYEAKYLFRNSSKAILLVDAYFDYPDTPGVVQVPVTDQKNGIICGWNPHNQKPALQHFLSLIRPEQ
ncbi:MAG: LysR family transcriptional regulator [Clostridiales bacterium]|nr:LysR family transcriptional regulator [Clostridiales bacterium]